MLPELADPAPSGEPPLGRELSSADTVIGREELVALLQRHELMVEQVSPDAGEMLR